MPLYRVGVDSPRMRAPDIAITCDCGRVGRVPLGDRWTCEECGRSWDTSQIPRDEYDALMRRVRRYSLLTVAPPLLLAAILVPLAVLVDVSYAFLLFVLVMGYALLVLPQLRKSARRQVLDAAPRWQLRPD
jgi:hypothetical protein